MITTAEIAGSRILVRPTMAETLVVAAIRGATWDRNARAFSLHATQANARLLRHRVAALRAIGALSALENPASSNPSTPAPAAPELQTSHEESPVATEPSITTTAPAPIAAPAPSLAPAPATQSAPAAPATEPVIQTLSTPAIALPQGLLVHPWKHQVEGYEFAMGALRQYHAALLAAQMGVGKTLVATMLALGLDARMVLVACPLRVIGSWRDQLAQYIAEYFVTAPLVDKIGTAAKRVTFAKDKLALARALKQRFFLIVNYDVMWRDEMARLLLSEHWDLVVYDESHRIKGIGGRASMFAKRLLPHATYRVLASGTPLAHSQLDIFGQFRAAAPSVFGPTYAAFKTRYAVMGGPSREWVVGYKNQADLEDRMAPLTWRCTKREALPDLPEQIDVEYATELSASAARIYRQLEQDMISEIEGHLLTAANCLAKVLRLQQLTGGALKTDDGASHIVDDGKRKLLADTLDDLGDEPVVIFCRFRSDIDAAHDACRESLPKHKDAQGHDLPVSLELSGTRDELERWQAGEAQALVVQVQAGSVGISLVRASVAIYYSLSSNLVEYDQSRSRIHRPGQKRPCTYIYLTCQGTIDQKILAALRARQDVIESIMRSVAEKAKQKEQ
jgi:SNF2 family DNA or RNA helicase